MKKKIKRRRQRRAYLPILFFLFLFLLLSPTARAAEGAFWDTLFPSDKTDVQGGGQRAELDRYMDRWAGGLHDDVSDALSDNALTELADVGYFCRYLLGAASEGMESLRGQLLTLTGLVILLSFAAMIRPDGQMGDALDLAMTVIAAAVLFRTVEASAERVGAYLSSVKVTAEVLTPTMCFLQTAGGHFQGAASTGVGVAWFFTFLETFCATVLLPLLRVLFGLSAVGALGGELPSASLVRTVRTLYMTLLGFLSTLVGAVLSLKSTLAVSADSLAFRTARYALGSFLPLVGGMVSGSLQTVAASLSLLKNTVGVGTAISLLLIMLPEVLQLFLTRTVLSFYASVSEMMGVSRARTLLSDVRGLYDMMLALVILPTLLLLFIITIFTRTALGA